MINQDKKIKAFFSTDELDMLYSLGISKNDTVAKAKETLEKYLEKSNVVYSNENKKKLDNNYLKLLYKIYDILPIYS